MPTCEDCGEPVDPKRCYHRVHGWERYRKGGGANKITLREVEAVYLCDGCMLVRSGGHRHQGELF